MQMDNNLRIPEDERHKFSQPLGKLIAGTRKDTISEVEKYFKKYIKKRPKINFYLVGDIVTKDFLANSFLKSFIKLCIVDEKTKRSRITIEFESFFEEVIEFESPAGHIPKECWDVLEKIIRSGKRTLLKIIEGEEDLLVLPLVLKISLEKNVKNFVFYGQPPITDSKHPIPEGIVMVNVNKAIQKAVRKYIELMEKT
ncbi:MAG: DUF359 domain-containing protein [Promethearchaeota archaeon]|nr:MAG: DUF359 domain-containing protein [Candidatus Lokiarchaeota archaeon]